MFLGIHHLNCSLPAMLHFSVTSSIKHATPLGVHCLKLFIFLIVKSWSPVFSHYQVDLIWTQTRSYCRKFPACICPPHQDLWASEKQWLRKQKNLLCGAVTFTLNWKLPESKGNTVLYTAVYKGDLLPPKKLLPWKQLWTSPGVALSTVMALHSNPFASACWDRNQINKTFTAN